jgi:hypothetical protein
VPHPGTVCCALDTRRHRRFPPSRLPGEDKQMRLWSLHPRYLDSRGLVALWREGLLAQAVLAGRTRGYRHHPQLGRFRQSAHARRYIAAYLRAVHDEAAKRGFNFDISRVGRAATLARLAVTTGQLEYEWAHLSAKLAKRAPSWLEQLAITKRIEPHPLFRVVRGGVAQWEKSEKREERGRLRIGAMRLPPSGKEPGK